MWKPNYPYLKDKSFLKEIDELKEKEQWIKITALTWNEENPIEEIQGYATGGTINLNGGSAVRRSGSLTMIAGKNNYDILNIRNIISINKKLAIEIGFTNTTNKTEYMAHKIIWFPLGVFIINNASITHNDKNLNISISISDKMCLLNGAIGGTFAAPVNFSELITVDEFGYPISSQQNLIEDIILHAVNEYGGVQLGQIFINDIGRTAKGLLKWTGEKTVYLNEKNQTLSYDNIFDDDQPIEYGKPVGYKSVDFIWPGTEALICQAGENVVSLLDKIKNALGNFEYFFDVYGNFWFQQKRNYLNQDIYVDKIEQNQNIDYLSITNLSKSVYQFTNANLITSFQNSPTYSNIKNDFIVWGEKSTSTGNIAIRYHLAIEKKPVPSDNSKYLVEIYDGIYGKQAKRATLKKKSVRGEEGVFYYTGEYDSSYSKLGDIYVYKNGHFLKPNIDDLKLVIIDNHGGDWRTEIYLQSVINADQNYYYNKYGAELLVEWPKVYDIAKIETGRIGNIKIYQGGFLNTFDQNEVVYWLDFIDDNPQQKGENFSISNIGQRLMVVSNNGVNCVFPPDIPDFYILLQGDQNGINEAIKNGYKYIITEPEIYENISMSGAFNSGYDAIKDLLYKHLNYNEKISIGAIPIFYLEPNSRISVFDQDSGIQGDYIIETISLPLDTKGIMNLSCSKAIEKL